MKNANDVKEMMGAAKADKKEVTVRIGKMVITKLEDGTPGVNPLKEDLFHMGVPIGKNVWALTERHESEDHDHIIIACLTTGTKIRIDL